MLARSKLAAVNRKARHDYFVIESVEAGIELVGTEVKSIRQGNVSMKECWADVKDGEMFVYGLHISPYEKGNIFNKDPLRVRKLLLHKREIRHLQTEKKLKGLTLIPLSIYFKGSYVKIEIGLCKGKKLHDKRSAEAERSAKRNIEQAIKQRVYE